MKCGVVHDDEVVGVQTRAPPRLQPGLEHPGIASTVEPQGLCQSPLHASRTERRPGASMSRDQAVHTLAFGGIPISPCRRRHKPAFIDVHGVFAAAYEPLVKTEKLLATQEVAFGIAQSFVYGSPPTCAARSRYSGGRRGTAAPVPLACDRDGLPHDRVTVPNPACGAGTLVGQAARREPAVHARLTNLEPPSRFGLAASTANKLHNPLAPIY